MSIWKKPVTNCAVKTEPVRRIVGLWEEADFSLEFTIENVQGNLRATAFELAAPVGVALTSRQRRLPTDAQLIEALLRNQDGARHAVWLANKLAEVVPDGMAATDLTREQVGQAMDEQAASLPRLRTTRPDETDIRTEVQWLKDEIQARRADGNYHASELIADYRTKYYGSTATAYRRLKRANEELERGQ